MGDEDIQKRWNEFVDLLKSTNREGIDDLIDWLDNKSDFKEAPASTKYHLNCRGGLLEHSLNVYHILNEDFRVYIDLFGIKQDTIILTALLHDICKANIYITEMRNVKRDNEWVQEPFYKVEDMLSIRHAEKSVILAQRYIKFNGLEVAMICGHMGFANVPQHDVQISELFTYNPQALLLHAADLFSTYMVECNTEGMDKYSKCGFNDLFLGRSATESLEKRNNPKSINISGTVYEIAKETDVVDNVNVILVNNSNGVQYKVYAPYGDGLPF